MPRGMQHVARQSRSRATLPGVTVVHHRAGKTTESQSLEIVHVLDDGVQMDLTLGFSFCSLCVEAVSALVWQSFG